MRDPTGLRSPRPTLVAVVAMARNRVIGRDGRMPWSVPSDLKRYRRLTMGKPMIMGRKTLAAIGRVLDGRDTIVLTRDSEVPFAGALVANSPEAALAIAERCAGARGVNEIVIAGGAEVYALFLPRTDRLEITRIEAEPDGDTFFPDLGRGEWTIVSDRPAARGEADDADSRVLVMERRRDRP